MSDLRDSQNIEELIKFLKLKGNNHQYYYHYTTWDSFVKIYTGRSFLLTRGNSLTINDQHEAHMKGSWDVWNKTYIGSFSFGSSENMAMWGLYGLPWQDAIRIAIPKEAMLCWIQSISHVSSWGDDETRKISSPNVTLTDIVYVSGVKNEDGVRLTHRDKSFTTSKHPGLFSVDRDPQMTGFIKNYAWSYENEVRIRVELTHDIDCEKILLSIPQETIDAIQITTGPYFQPKRDTLYDQLDKQHRISESGFNNLVRYRALCSMCQHENFIRKHNA